MARVYLAEEVQEVIRAAMQKLQTASQAIAVTEQNVLAAVAAHLTPAQVNAIGIEGYQSAGILMKEATDIIGALAPDASAGLYFPRIAAIGSPAEFDRFHVDVESVTGDRGTITAYSKSDVSVFPNPWSELVDGEKVRLQRFDANIPGGTDINGTKLQGITCEIDTKDTTSSKHRLMFTDVFKFFNDGAELVTVSTVGGDGNEGETLVIRQITQP